MFQTLRVMDSYCSRKKLTNRITTQHNITHNRVTCRAFSDSVQPDTVITTPPYIVSNYRRRPPQTSAKHSREMFFFSTEDRAGKRLQKVTENHRMPFIIYVRYYYYIRSHLRFSSVRKKGRCETPTGTERKTFIIFFLFFSDSSRALCFTLIRRFFVFFLEFSPSPLFP